MMKELSMHILDIAQNSITAGAKNIGITVTEDITNNMFSFEIKDDGCGMSAEMLEAVRNPFTTSRKTRKVGLGIPMLEQTCLMCNGRLELKSTQGVGTYLGSFMEYDNIDRPPMGDLENSLFLLLIMNPEVDFMYRHIYEGNEYELNTKEIKEALEDMPINDPAVADWLKGNITEGLEAIRAEGAL